MTRLSVRQQAAPGAGAGPLDRTPGGALGLKRKARCRGASVAVWAQPSREKTARKPDAPQEREDIAARRRIAFPLQTEPIMAGEVENNPWPRGEIVSAFEIVGYTLLVAAVWQGSGFVSQLAVMIGTWLGEQPVHAPHRDEFQST